MRLINFAIFLSIMFLFPGCREKTVFPEKITDNQLTRVLSGTEAKRIVDRIHLNNVATEDNSIGFYEGSSGQSIIYITVYNSQEMADTEWKRMADKISPENSVFVMGSVSDWDGKKVYRCFGMGQTHFVFTHNSMLIWVTTETTSAKSFLENYLNYLN